MPATSLRIASDVSKFRYAIADASGRARGELRMKTYPKDPIALDFDGRPYRIDYALTRGGFVVDSFRFSLVDAAGETLATGEKIAGKRAFVVSIADREYRFEKYGSLFSLRYALRDAGGGAVGTFADITGFSLWKRRFQVDLPADIDAVVGGFLCFLVVNLHFN